MRKYFPCTNPRIGPEHCWVWPRNQKTKTQKAKPDTFCFNKRERNLDYRDNSSKNIEIKHILEKTNKFRRCFPNHPVCYQLEYLKIIFSMLACFYFFLFYCFSYAQGTAHRALLLIHLVWCCQHILFSDGTLGHDAPKK